MQNAKYSLSLNFMISTTLLKNIPSRLTLDKFSCIIFQIKVSAQLWRWRTESRAIFYKRQIQVDDSISALYRTSEGDVPTRETKHVSSIMLNVIDLST